MNMFNICSITVTDRGSYAFILFMELLHIIFKQLFFLVLKQAGQGDARSIMEDVGMKPEMDMHTLLVRLIIFMDFICFPLIEPVSSFIWGKKRLTLLYINANIFILLSLL